MRLVSRFKINLAPYKRWRLIHFFPFLFSTMFCGISWFWFSCAKTGMGEWMRVWLGFILFCLGRGASLCSVMLLASSHWCRSSQNWGDFGRCGEAPRLGWHWIWGADVHSLDEWGKRGWSPSPDEYHCDQLLCIHLWKPFHFNIMLHLKGTMSVCINWLSHSEYLVWSLNSKQ